MFQPITLDYQVYIQLPFEKKPTCRIEFCPSCPHPTLGVESRRDASKVGTLPIGWTPRTAGRPGAVAERCLTAGRSGPVFCGPFCHLQILARALQENESMSPRHCLRQRHQWPLHNLLSTSVQCHHVRMLLQIKYV